MSKDSALETVVNLFIDSSLTPEKQFNDLVNIIPRELLERAFTEFQKRVGPIRRMTPPPLLSQPSNHQEEWYIGGDKHPKAQHWPKLKKYLIEEKKWSQEAVTSINIASDKIVAWLEHPFANRFQTRGLAVGYVQSGKTANFTAVIAKAADAGYRFFIVLSGTKVSLRSQTQHRLSKELVDLDDRLWYTPTQNSDFNLEDNPNFFLNPDKDSRILCVVKKNAVLKD